jgi:hypothetical protein
MTCGNRILTTIMRMLAQGRFKPSLPTFERMSILGLLSPFSRNALVTADLVDTDIFPCSCKGFNPWSSRT